MPKVNEATLGRCDFKQYEHCGAHEQIPDVGQRLPPFGCKNWKVDEEQNLGVPSGQPLKDNSLKADPDAGTAWLLERAGKAGPEWITASGGWLNWTSDPNLALRLARRADADQLAEIVEDCECVTEHQWG